MRTRGPARLALLALLLWGCTRVGTEPPLPPADLPPPGVDRGRTGAEPARDGAHPEARLRPAALDREAEEIFLRGGMRTPLPLALPPETGNVRALWIVRTALLHPDSARAAVRRAHEAGYNTLLVQVRGRGDAYYRSAYEPWPDAMNRSLQATYDPLQVVLDEARPRGLRVHAWLNLHLVASALLPPRDPGHLYHRAPEVLAVPRELAPRLWSMSPQDPRYREALLSWTASAGDRVEGIYTNPAHPEVRMHLAAVVRDLIARYPLDGVHFDYVRYPGPEFDYSRTSLEAFRGWMRGERGHLPDRISPGASAEGPPFAGVDASALLRAEAEWGTNPLGYTNLFPNEWGAFRRGQITAALETLYWTVKDQFPHMLVSAAVFANAEDAHRARFQEWERWLEMGIVEVVAPMAYTNNDEIFRSQIARAARAAGGERVWAGVGIYQNSFDGSVRKGRAATQLGAGGVALFSYDWAVGPDGVRSAGGDFLGRYLREVWGR